MLSFWKFYQLVEGSRRSGAKSGLYPLGYDGIGNYTPADQVTHAADALYYLDKDDRLFDFHDGPPFDITHLDGDVIEPKGHGMPGKEHPVYNSKMEPDIISLKYKIPPGDVVKPTSWVKLVTHPKLLDPRKMTD